MKIASDFKIAASCCHIVMNMMVRMKTKVMAKLKINKEMAGELVSRLIDTAVFWVGLVGVGTKGCRT